MIHSAIVMVPNGCPCNGHTIFLVFNPKMRMLYHGLVKQGHSPEWVVVEAETMVHRAGEQFRRWRAYP